MKTRTKVIWAVMGVTVMVGVVLFGGLTRIRPFFIYFDADMGIVTRGPRDTVDQQLAKLGFSNIAYNVPKTMNIRDTAIIQLKLSLKKSIDELERMIEAPGEKEGHSIQISKRMKATLSGGSDFVTTLRFPDDATQAISENETTEWKWEVKPINEGHHRLGLTLSVILIVDGILTPRAFPVFEKIIEVEVTWSQRAGMFFEKNWQWLWAALLVPIAGWLWQWKRGAKASDGHSDG
jgi:hypothetical protein